MVTESPWKVKEFDFPKDVELTEQLTFLIRYALLAPSNRNMQPWRFSVTPKTIKIYPDLSRKLPVADPTNRELYISLGCALENILVAADYFGFHTKVNYLPEGETSGPAAVVSLEPEKEPFSRSLFFSITRRHTNRHKYGPISIEKELLENLSACRGEKELSFDIVTDKELKEHLGKIIAEGDILQFSNKTFREEYAAWLRPNLSSVEDGIPGYAQGVSMLPSLFTRAVVRGLGLSKNRAEKNSKLVEASPAVAIISSKRNDKESWLRVGQYYERLALLATSLGIVQAPLNQPTEIPELATRLANLLDRKERPQMIFRMGHANPALPTPRRPLEKVLL